MKATILYTMLTSLQLCSAFPLDVITVYRRSITGGNGSPEVAVFNAMVGPRTKPFDDLSVALGGAAVAGTTQGNKIILTNSTGAGVNERNAPLDERLRVKRRRNDKNTLNRVHHNTGTRGIMKSHRQARNIKTKKAGQRFHLGAKSHKHGPVTTHQHKKGHYKGQRQGKHQGHIRKYHQGYHRKKHDGDDREQSKSHQKLGEAGVKDDSGYESGDGLVIDEPVDQGDLGHEDEDGGYSHGDRYVDEDDKLDNRDESDENEQMSKHGGYTNEIGEYADKDERKESQERRPSTGERLTEELYGLDKESLSNVEENTDQHSSETRKSHGSKGGARHGYAEDSGDSNTPEATWDEYDSERHEQFEDDNMENLRGNEYDDDDDDSSIEKRSISYNSDLDNQKEFDKWLLNEKNKAKAAQRQKREVQTGVRNRNHDKQADLKWLHDTAKITFALDTARKKVFQLKPESLSSIVYAIIGIQRVLDELGLILKGCIKDKNMTLEEVEGKLKVTDLARFVFGNKNCNLGGSESKHTVDWNKTDHVLLAIGTQRRKRDLQTDTNNGSREKQADLKWLHESAKIILTLDAVRKTMFQLKPKSISSLVSAAFRIERVLDELGLMLKGCMKERKMTLEQVEDKLNMTDLARFVFGNKNCNLGGSESKHNVDWDKTDHMSLHEKNSNLFVADGLSSADTKALAMTNPPTGNATKSTTNRITSEVHQISTRDVNAVKKDVQSSTLTRMLNTEVERIQSTPAQKTYKVLANAVANSFIGITNITVEFQGEEPVQILP